jgi:hypothetical protein
MPSDTKTLMEKIAALPPERIAEIEDFVDFIRLREQERALTRAAAAASVPAGVYPRAAQNADPWTAIWDNPDDAAYDSL